MKGNQFKKQREEGTIRIGDEMFTVSGEEYAAYYAEMERWKYIKRIEKDRMESYERLVEDGMYAMLGATPHDMVEEAAAENIMIEKMHTAIEQLDAADKMLIRLLFFDGVSCRMVAKRLGVNEGTVRYRRDNVLRQLKIGIIG